MKKLIIKNQTKNLVLGIDPGSGTKSNTGIALYKPEGLELIYLDEIAPLNKYGSPDERIYEISAQYKSLLDSMEIPQEELLVCIEYFVMKGKSGETLNRLIGGLIGNTPYEIKHISNMIVKQKITGFGGGDDKKAIGRGLESYFRNNKQSVEIIKDLIEQEQWDKLDSLAIAVSGYEEYINEPIKTKKSKNN